MGLTAVALIAMAGVAQGAVTIGSNLTTAASTNTNCNIDCTTTNRALPGANQASGGLTSPVNGVITSWRASAGASAVDLRLRVLRPGAGLTYTGAGSSGPASFMDVSDPISTSLPIQIGDAIGLENIAGNNVLGANPGATQAYFNMPSLPDGSTRTASTDTGVETLVQATIEPTNTLGLSAQPVRNKKKGTATLTISVPNPGQLDFSGTGINIAETAAVKTVTAPGPVKFLISAAGKKRKKLNRKGKVGVTATFTFTPTGGAASTQSTPIQLKKKLKKK